jgi:hypothetical protein
MEGALRSGIPSRNNATSQMSPQRQPNPQNAKETCASFYTAASHSTTHAPQNSIIALNPFFSQREIREKKLHPKRLVTSITPRDCQIPPTAYRDLSANADRWESHVPECGAAVMRTEQT